MRKVWCENCADDKNGKGYLETELKEYFGMHVCNVCAENFERGMPAGEEELSDKEIVEGMITGKIPIDGEDND